MEILIQNQTRRKLLQKNILTNLFSDLKLPKIYDIFMRRVLKGKDLVAMKEEKVFVGRLTLHVC